jgi:arylsulfatase A-like enzyme
MRFVSAMKLLPLVLGFLIAAGSAGAAEPTRHVLIVVMDGLRPDSVVPGDMPNLSRLAGEGTFFARHHAVYISSTEVNGTALATGMQPGRSMIVANREYRPTVDPLFPVDTQDPWAVWHGDREGGGDWVGVDTLPEIVRAAGLRTAVSGTKGVSLLWDRSRTGRTTDSATVFEGDTIPGAAKDAIIELLGPIPLARDRRYFVNSAQDAWTTRAVTDVLWTGELPALSVVWLSEPDYAQHGAGPGTPLARAALRSSDTQLGLLLASLDARGLRASTNVLVVSDHGFSTISQNFDVGTDLARAGFRIGGGFLQAPDRGTVVMVGLGGSIALYVVGRDAAITTRLVQHLQGTGYAGVLLTRDGLPGTFRLSDVGMDAPDAPDVVVSMRWGSDTPARAGAPQGTLIYPSSDYAPGMGMHGSLSRFDMANTLIAAGPDFRSGFRSETPSANSDIAPTVLRLLGLEVPAGMDGRVLSEAFAGSTGPGPAVETETLRASTTVGSRPWQQYLIVSRVEGRTYYDEGNSGPAPAR